MKINNCNECLWKCWPGFPLVPFVVMMIRLLRLKCPDLDIKCVNLTLVRVGDGVYIHPSLCRCVEQKRGSRRQFPGNSDIAVADTMGYKVGPEPRKRAANGPLALGGWWWWTGSESVSASAQKAHVGAVVPPESSAGGPRGGSSAQN